VAIRPGGSWVGSERSLEPQKPSAAPALRKVLVDVTRGYETELAEDAGRRWVVEEGFGQDRPHPEAASVVKNSSTSLRRVALVPVGPPDPVTKTGGVARLHEADAADELSRFQRLEGEHVLPRPLAKLNPGESGGLRARIGQPLGQADGLGVAEKQPLHGPSIGRHNRA
jgi:hypothetical protein